MEERTGWIRQYRKELDSAVFNFKDAGILKVWQWCKMKANYREQTFEGVVIHPGEFVTGRIEAAKELKISQSGVYRRLHKLQELGSITLKSNNRFTIVTLCQWRTYNCDKCEDEQQVNNSRTTGEQQVNNNRTQEKEREEYKEVKNNKNNGRKRPDVFTPPSIEEVKEYCKQRGGKVDPEAFVNFYESKGWMVGSNKMKCWQAAVRTWEKNNNCSSKQSEPFDLLAELDKS